MKLGKRFLQWLELHQAGKPQFLATANALLAPLEKMNFQWKDVAHISGLAPPGTINLEREVVAGQMEFVQIIFDKYHRARFQVNFGSRHKDAPHEWISAGSLVWRRDESVRFKWWGAKWWTMRRLRAMKRATERVVLLMPEVGAFLADGVEGPNILRRK